MRTYIKYIFIFPLLTIFSCGEDFVNQPILDSPSIDNYYKSEADVRAATASLYGMPWFEFNDKFFWAAGEELAGNLYHTWDQEGQFFYFSYNEGNAIINSGWRGLYRVASYANSIINDMPVFAEGKVSQNVIAKGVAEGRCMRGAAYYFLSEFWGEVPIVEDAAAVLSSGNTEVPKYTRSSVYEFILRDLQFAADNLPATDEPGRLTSWAAKGLLAKTYLTMAQYYKNTDAAKSNEYFNQAKTISADVIDNSGLSLMPKYEDLYKIEHNNNMESLIAMQWTQGNYAIGNSRQANFARSSIITGNTEAWGSGKCMTQDFLDQVTPADNRKSAIYMDEGDHYPEINKASGGYQYLIVNRDAADPNKILENASPTLTALKKYVVGSAEDNEGKVTTGQAAAINQYILRLADVYLINVEATIGSGESTSDAKAIGYLNTVRNRAGLASVSSVTFSELLRERRIEFALEGMYWLDLKRYFYRSPQGATDMLSAQKREYVYDRDQSPTAADENSRAGYKLRIAGNNGVIQFRAENINLPIPSAEVVLNPKLAAGVAAEEYPF